MSNTYEIVNRAFSKQSVHYDQDDEQNIIIKDWRHQVYTHVHQFLRPKHKMLELNAGTGIDALHFASNGYQIHATDLSDGMIVEIEKKMDKHHLYQYLTSQQLSYEELNDVSNSPFDYVFSNFGGLNCVDDLSKITRHLPEILNEGGYVTWVIMPKIHLWEMGGFFLGHGKKAFRRWNKNGVRAHLEGEYFQTYYFSFSQIKKAFGSQFKLIKAEGLGAVSPPPHRGDFPKKYPALYSFLTKADSLLRHFYPFNRWADHIIVTFQFTKK